MITNLTFTSSYFFVLAAVVVILYYIIPKYNWIVLLVASILFYATWGIEKLPFILISALIAFFSAKYITKKNDVCDEKVKKLSDDSNSKNEEKKLRIDTKKRNKCVLIISIILLVLLLSYVKIGKLLSDALSSKGLSIIVPLGISYYTFSLIGYVADCYWRKEKAETNYFKLLLFAIYFPKILQGPISRHKFLSSQLTEKQTFDYKNLTYGLQLMLIGYFKKLVIADRLAVFVSNVYGNYESMSGSMLAMATLFGAFQLYCDFSGCMDIACGFSEVIGIKLEKNFNHPFFSESAAEFWRRWHITLGTWFKDYIYMPISISPWMIKLMGNIKKKFSIGAAKNISTIIGLLFVWLLTGLWHGTGLNYVVWGIYWGNLIILGIILQPFFSKITKKLHIKTESPDWHLFRKLRTFFLFIISRILTIPSSLHTSKVVFKKILFELHIGNLIDGTLYNQGLSRLHFILILFSLILLYFASKLEEKGGDIRDWIAERQIVVRWGILYSLIFSILIFGMYDVGYDTSQFVYMQY